MSFHTKIICDKCKKESFELINTSFEGIKAVAKDRGWIIHENCSNCGREYHWCLKCARTII